MIDSLFLAIENKLLNHHLINQLFSCGKLYLQKINCGYFFISIENSIYIWYHKLELVDKWIRNVQALSYTHFVDNHVYNFNLILIYTLNIDIIYC